MGLDSTISPIVATPDLSSVRLVCGALRTADLTGSAPAAGLGPAPSGEPRDSFCPAPVLEPRVTLHPTPRIESRLVLHPAPRIEPRSCRDAGLAPCDIEPLPPPASYCTYPLPIQPPWKVLPWQNPLPARPVVKIVVRRPDLSRKGSLVDRFM